MTYPLAGIKVLDFTRVLAGPFASRMLADLGADVVKVEPPEGDMTRSIGRKVNDLSAYFTQQNVGKRAICVDLTKAGSTELLLQLAAEADVVMENFRPGVMSGSDWDGKSYPQSIPSSSCCRSLALGRLGQNATARPTHRLFTVRWACSNVSNSWMALTDHEILRYPLQTPIPASMAW